MPITAPPAPPTLPTAPSTSDPDNFDLRADAYMAAQPDFRTGMLDLANNAYANALESQSAATSASASQAAAAASVGTVVAAAGAAAWVSGTTYAIGDVRYSPSNKRIYRRTTAGSGTTDPSADPTNWGVVDPEAPVVVVSTTAQTAVAGLHYVSTNVAASTLTLPSTPASGDQVTVTCANGLLTNSIARNGQTIMGLAEDMTIDSANATLRLRFLNSSWRLV